MLAMLGEQFMVGEEICGAVVSIRLSGIFNIEPMSTDPHRNDPDLEIRMMPYPLVSNVALIHFLAFWYLEL